VLSLVCKPYRYYNYLCNVLADPHSPHNHLAPSIVNKNKLIYSFTNKIYRQCFMNTCKLIFIVAGVDESEFVVPYECSATFFTEELKEYLTKIPYNDSSLKNSFLTCFFELRTSIFLCIIRFCLCKHKSQVTVKGQHKILVKAATITSFPVPNIVKRSHPY